MNNEKFYRSEVAKLAVKEQEEEQHWLTKLTGKTSPAGLPTRTLPAEPVSIRLWSPFHRAPSTPLLSLRSVTFPKTQWGAADLKTLAMAALKGISIVDEPPDSSSASPTASHSGDKEKEPMTGPELKKVRKT